MFLSPNTPLCPGICQILSVLWVFIRYKCFFFLFHRAAYTPVTFYCTFRRVLEEKSVLTIKHFVSRDGFFFARYLAESQWCFYLSEKQNRIRCLLFKSKRKSCFWGTSVGLICTLMTTCTRMQRGPTERLVFRVRCSQFCLSLLLLCCFST